MRGEKIFNHIWENFKWEKIAKKGNQIAVKEEFKQEIMMIKDGKKFYVTEILALILVS